MTDTEREALCARIDELCAEVEKLRKAKDTMRGDAFEIGAMLVKARDENAKLRAENERLTETLQGAEREADRLTHEAAELLIENAKLRELCSGLAQVVKNDDDTFRRLREIAKQELSYDFIGMYDSSLGEIDQIAHFIDSMAELGIEVPS